MSDLIQQRLAQHARLTRVALAIHDDLDRAVAAHDIRDPRHPSRGGQHTNGRCCALGSVNPGAIRTLREWRDALWSAMSGGAPEVLTLALCEQGALTLRPDTLYRFVVIPGCARCEELAAVYAAEKKG